MDSLHDSLLEWALPVSQGTRSRVQSLALAIPPALQLNYLSYLRKYLGILCSQYKEAKWAAVLCLKSPVI